MKHLKTYNESIFDIFKSKSKLSKKIRNEIRDICEKYGIYDYTINEDGSIDVDDNVYMMHRQIDKLPLKFRNVTGSFNCARNKLTTLKGCPISVDDSFYCYNNELTSLEGGPESIGGDFDCHENRLSSLEGCPKSVGRDFDCFNNQLTSLEGCPKSVGRDFYCDHNEIVTFEHLPYSIGGDFYCVENPIYEIWKLFEDYSKIELFNYYDIIQDSVIILDRLNVFLEEIGKRTVAEVKGYKCI
jgi:hypothetical protein